MSEVERRREVRRRCSDPIFWRADRRDEYRVGWLLERSANGAAFVIRDAYPPNVTDLLEVHVWRLPDGRRAGRGFVVHRVRPIHEDLCLVAGKFVPLHEERDIAELVGATAATESEFGELAAVEIEALPDPAPLTTSIWHG
ncbi:MAG: hypothetical protein R3B68_00510 [Phycisphaerales bacterium]